MDNNDLNSPSPEDKKPHPQEEKSPRDDELSPESFELNLDEEPPAETTEPALDEPSGPGLLLDVDAPSDDLKPDPGDSPPSDDGPSLDETPSFPSEPGLSPGDDAPSGDLKLDLDEPPSPDDGLSLDESPAPEPGLSLGDDAPAGDDALSLEGTPAPAEAGLLLDSESLSGDLGMELDESPSADDGLSLGETPAPAPEPELSRDDETPSGDLGMELESPSLTDEPVSLEERAAQQAAPAPETPLPEKKVQAPTKEVPPPAPKQPQQTAPTKKGKPSFEELARQEAQLPSEPSKEVQSESRKVVISEHTGEAASGIIVDSQLLKDKIKEKMAEKARTPQKKEEKPEKELSAEAPPAQQKDRKADYTHGSLLLGAGVGMVISLATLMSAVQLLTGAAGASPPPLFGLVGIVVSVLLAGICIGLYPQYQKCSKPADDTATAGGLAAVVCALGKFCITISSRLTAPVKKIVYALAVILLLVQPFSFVASTLMPKPAPPPVVKKTSPAKKPAEKPAVVKEAAEPVEKSVAAEEKTAVKKPSAELKKEPAAEPKKEPPVATVRYSDPNKFFSVVLPRGYSVQESTSSRKTDITLTYSPELKATIVAYKIKDMPDMEDQMYNTVMSLQKKAGTAIKRYNLITFGGGSGYEIILTGMFYSTHVYVLYGKGTLASISVDSKQAEGNRVAQKLEESIPSTFSFTQ